MLYAFHVCYTNAYYLILFSSLTKRNSGVTFEPIGQSRSNSICPWDAVRKYRTRSFGSEAVDGNTTQ